ncbi:glycosyltransferase family A protein [Lonepinella sp. BR2474]|uniref:glycosyltransferase family A protein n=1 Tax=Lonepinella sp. BR2474 TaxID=3434548 RepID=UPI003F6E1920
MSNQPLTFAVITATVGRPALERTILSVQNQTYPCKHYVFVDGKQFWDKVKPLEEKYPDVVFTYLPMNTGANGGSNSRINATAPFLVKENIICYLDDDNWYDENHIESFVPFFHEHSDLHYAYHLRRLYDENGEFICDDNFDSIGFWKMGRPNYIDEEGNSYTLNSNFFVDTNCYAIKRNIAIAIAQAWHDHDRGIFKRLSHAPNLVGCNTAIRTVNYIPHLTFTFSTGKKMTPETKMQRILCLFYEMNAQKTTQKDWLIPTLYKDKQLIRLK